VHTKQRIRVYEGVGPPPPNSGPPTKWGHLPLEEVQVGDLIEITMDSEEVQVKINAVRSYAGRLARKTGKKFSVRITDYGMGIWRIQ
tara:strand:+ start:403 stop:663 length:261 start_codon:yes stop_codon:yes gene_type:complete